jgi:hypothetical protein
MSMAQKTGRITSVPFDSLLSVNTYWDLGIDDSMSIWFVQLFANEVRHIDYYESSGEGIAHYIKVLRGQIEGFEHMSQYVYGKHYGPHDLAVRELGTGVSRLEKAKTLGINFEVVKRPTAKEDGIEAIRSIIPRSYYDKKRCARGISALKGYRKKWNDKLMVYENVPVHDWTSHATDAEQTLALTNPQAKRNHVRPQIKRSKFHV